MKILIVEDDELSQRILNIMLTRLGHTVVGVTDGAEALQVIQSTQFDMIFLDLHLPHLSGIEVCRQFRSSEKAEGHLPIIALTASIEDVDVADYCSAGMDDYIAKPFKKNQIIQVLEACEKGLYRLDKNSLNENNFQLDPETANLLLDVKNAMKLFANDEAEYKKLLFEFTATLPERFLAMQESLEARQWKDLTIHAHNLKGISAYFGANQLTGLAKQIEDQCNQGEIDNLKKTLTDIKNNMKKISFEATRI